MRLVELIEPKSLTFPHWLWDIVSWRNLSSDQWMKDSNFTVKSAPNVRLTFRSELVKDIIDRWIWVSGSARTCCERGQLRLSQRGRNLRSSDSRNRESLSEFIVLTRPLSYTYMRKLEYPHLHEFCIPKLYSPFLLQPGQIFSKDLRFPLSLLLPICSWSHLRWFQKKMPFPFTMILS